MKYYNRIFLFFGVFFCALVTVNAQEKHSGESNVHRISMAMGHSHIKKGLQHEGSYGITSSSWLLDYDYWLSRHFALGLHSDIILENFLVEEHVGSHESGILERHYPLASVPVVLYKPWNHIVLLTGVGGEFSKEENLFVYRAGVEYGWHLPSHWELGVSFNYDVKRNAYDTWTLGFGISKLIGKSKSSNQHHSHI